MNTNVPKGSGEPHNTHPDNGSNLSAPNGVESNVVLYPFPDAFVYFMQQLKTMHDWFDCEYGIKNPHSERGEVFKKAYDGVFEGVMKVVDCISELAGMEFRVATFWNEANEYDDVGTGKPL